MKRFVLFVFTIIVLSQGAFANFTAQSLVPVNQSHLVAANTTFLHQSPKAPNDIVQILGDKAFRNWLFAVGINFLSALFVLVTSSKTLMYLALAISIPVTMYATLFTGLTIGKFIHSDSTNYKAVVKATIFPIIIYSLMILLSALAAIA